MARASAATTVYVVDDDEGVRCGFARLLRSAKLEARCYESCERFLSEILNVEHACILLDVTMPEMTGPEVQRQLNLRGIRVPVIAVSARDDDGTRTRAHDLGARMFLRKPVDDQALLDAIHWVTQPVQRD